MSPPAIDVIVAGLRPIVSVGLPVRPEYQIEDVLAMRGVVARSINPDDRLNRIKALDGLIRTQLVHFPDDELSEAARVLFGLAPGSRGKTLTARRQQAASESGYEADHFRKHVEPKIVRQLAWLLHQDSQNYIPRSNAVAPPLESNGDTPTISAGDISSKERAQHEEALSRLWAHVYTLRAEILRVERLKSWPHDETEPLASQMELDTALAARDREVEAVKIMVQGYIDRYGQRIRQGEADFNAHALLRLAGWEQKL